MYVYIYIHGQTPSFARTRKDHHRRNVMMTWRTSRIPPPTPLMILCIFQGSWGRIWHVMMRNNQDTPQPPPAKW